MVDKKDVLRGTAMERKLKDRFDQRMQIFKNDMKSYPPPDRAVLENTVEETAKCGKCSGHVRAVLQDVQPSQSYATDLEILVSLNCRNAECAWTANQWRPWVRTKPTEL